MWNFSVNRLNTLLLPFRRTSSTFTLNTEEVTRSSGEVIMVQRSPQPLWWLTAHDRAIYKVTARLEMSGNLAAVMEVSEIMPKVGKCWVKTLLGENRLLPASHLGLCRCLVTSFVHVYCTFNYNVGNCNSGRNVARCRWISRYHDSGHLMFTPLTVFPAFISTAALHFPVVSVVFSVLWMHCFRCAVAVVSNWLTG